MVTGEVIQMEGRGSHIEKCGWCREREMVFSPTHLNRDQIESNLSVPGIQGCHENAQKESYKVGF